MAANRRDQREVRAARRRAKASAGGTRVLPRSFTRRASQSPAKYVEGVFNGTIEEPPVGSEDGKILAKYGSFARHHKANPDYEKAFNKFWYHKDDKTTGNQADAA